jgi:hypothetical protein
MLFTNIRTYNTSNINNNTHQNNNGNNISLIFTSNKKNQPNIPKGMNLDVSNMQNHTKTYKSPKIQSSNVIINENRKRLQWGEPFWNFFHILAEKVKEESFASIRKDLLSIIYVICSNLPCPDCSSHAVAYLNGINFNNLRTKEDLKYALYNFHNAVNIRTRAPLFSKVELESKYKRGVLPKSYEVFMYYFRMKHNNVRLMTDDLHRHKLSTTIDEWFQTNHVHFS